MAKPKAIGEAEATELEQIHAQCTKLEEELEMWKLKVKALTLSNRVSEIQEEWGAGTSSGESNKEVSIVLQANQENLAVRVLKKFIGNKYRVVFWILL